MNETTMKDNNVATYGNGLASSAAMTRLVSDSARRAQESIRAHPYYTAGIAAAVGLGICGAALLVMGRRRTIFERFMDLF